MSGVTCCYECKEREWGCHSKCERYSRQKREWEEAKKKMKKDASPVISWGDYIGGLKVLKKGKQNKYRNSGK